ncbi:aKG-HExxH-type peptide beta-hydroxylase [Umezawaea sp. NPDC059074]|uniref:aKG-HExxH-type peptide beta-hydroxylase n=1 Tax=Umezawaea sp. NPDC059074 TaxID=3346716 RepID=UPI0036BCE374
MPTRGALVHELQHSNLSASMDFVVLHQELEGPVVLAPWRDDPRPLGGPLQGTTSSGASPSSDTATRHRSSSSWWTATSPATSGRSSFPEHSVSCRSSEPTELGRVFVAATLAHVTTCSPAGRRGSGSTSAGRLAAAAREPRNGSAATTWTGRARDPISWRPG